MKLIPLTVGKDAGTERNINIVKKRAGKIVIIKYEGNLIIGELSKEREYRYGLPLDISHADQRRFPYSGIEGIWLLTNNNCNPGYIGEQGIFFDP